MPDIRPGQRWRSLKQPSAVVRVTEVYPEVVYYEYADGEGFSHFTVTFRKLFTLLEDAHAGQ